MDPYQSPQSQFGDNPYAPPLSSLAPAHASGIPFAINDIVNWSWSIFTKRLRKCTSLFWGVCGARLILTFVLTATLDGLQVGVRDEIMFKLLYILALFAAHVADFWLSIGMTIAMLKIARGQPVLFEDVFRGGRFVLTVILAWIVHKVLIAVPIAVAVGVIVGGVLLMENQSGVAAFLLFMVVSGVAGLIFIYLSARVSMYHYLVIDHGAGVFGSLLESWRMCRTQVGTIILMYFVQCAVLIAGLLALCVGLVFAIPLATLIETVTYLALLTGAASGTAKPAFSWDEEI